MTKTGSQPDSVKYLYTGPDEQTKYKCKICGTLRKQSGNVWSNLLSHLNEKHPDWKEQVQVLKKGGTLNKYVDQKGNSI